MAWDFAAEIHSLADYNADDASTTGTSGEVLSAHATQWLTDGAKEIINQLPLKLKEKCATVTPLNNSSTTMDLDGVGDILYVTRLSADSGGYQVPCRAIPPQHGGLATDPNDLNYYGTASDPVYWWASNTSDAGTLFVKPDPTANQIAYVHHITYPSVSFGDSSIANFPDEAEYLVVLYAATKACLYQLNSLQTNTDITTAFTAVNTELDETQAICDLINTQVDAAVTELGESATQVDSSIDTALGAILTAAGRVNTAVALANEQFDLANTKVDEEDIELATGYIATGGGYLNEAQASVAEASTYASEVSARIAQVGGYNTVVSGYISAASGYASELSSKITIANGYIAEASARLQQDNTRYQWYDAQYSKLNSEYQRGLTALKGVSSDS